MNFETEKITLSIHNHTIHLNTVTNIDALYDALIAKGSDHEDVQDERLPYWAELWAAAIGCSEYLIENELITSESTVLELGCGLGLPSIVAGKLGAKKVVLTDYLDEALLFAKQNWVLNLPLENVVFENVDWRNPNPNLSADIIIASDVAYEKRAFEPLLQAFENLSKKNTRIIIAEPNRPVSKAFFSSLNTEGYIVKHSMKKVERKGHVFTVNIYELNKIDF
jgi:predicted nicotinamide N-methyase